MTGVEAASAADVGATTSPGGGVGRGGPADSPGWSSASAIAGATAINEESTNETRFPYFVAVRAILCDLLRVMKTDCVVRGRLPPKPRASDP